MTRCSCCGLDLPESSFWKDSRRASGLQSACKECKKKRFASWVSEHKAKAICIVCGVAPATHGQKCKACRDAINANVSEVAAERIRNGMCRKCGKVASEPGGTTCRACRDSRNESTRRFYYTEDGKKVFARRRLEQKLNPKIRESVRKNHAKRRATDIQYKLRSSLRVRMWSAMRAQQKSGSAVGDLGCTVPEFKAHIESLFTEGMTWDNWGKNAGCWQLDHIKPLHTFDLSDRKQFLEACNYTNIRPLWMEENLARNRKTNKETWGNGKDN